MLFEKEVVVRGGGASLMCFCEYLSIFMPRKYYYHVYATATTTTANWKSCIPGEKNIFRFNM